MDDYVFNHIDLGTSLLPLSKLDRTFRKSLANWALSRSSGLPLREKVG